MGNVSQQPIMRCNITDPLTGNTCVDYLSLARNWEQGIGKAREGLADIVHIHDSLACLG